MKHSVIVSVFFLSTTFITCKMNSQNQPSSDNIVTEAGTYTSAGVICNTYTAFSKDLTVPKPAIIVVPEWWGLNDYIRNRARQLAALGYVAIAIDVFGNGKQGSNPDEAGALVEPFYKNPELTKMRLDAAIAVLKINPHVDTSNIAAIGYCFGGFTVLNAAKLGADLKCVVSFHGGLGGAPVNKSLLKAKILVCHGDADKFVSEEEVRNFKKGLDSIGASYIFKSYPNATHGFTNPAATENGKKFNIPIAYNSAADSASWNDMKNFFSEILK